VGFELGDACEGVGVLASEFGELMFEVGAAADEFVPDFGVGRLIESGGLNFVGSDAEWNLEDVLDATDFGVGDAAFVAFPGADGAEGDADAFGEGLLGESELGAGLFDSGPEVHV
jgi:hypothetical protein